MKTLSLFVGSIFFLMTTMAAPANYKSLPDLSKDEVFVKCVTEILSLPANVADRKSALISVGKSILELKNKYAELNDDASASLMINTAIDKLAKEEKITKLNNTSYKSQNFACLRAFARALVACLRNSTSYTELSDCALAAYDDFLACLEEN